MAADAESVQVIDTRVGFDGFFRVDVHKLRYRKFDGGWSEVVYREVFERGSAAAVLPYDPHTEKLVLIRQFLAGFHFTGRDAFPLHILAGMINPNETPAEAAHREAMEEAGLSLSRQPLERIASYLPSPGGSSEVITVFAACVDASVAGGGHGLAAEHEDIRVEVLSADDAISLLDRGEIEDGPTLVALLWFARHRDRLKREWRIHANRG
ncbi:MAG TPA: NUDIX domain-containing protein [Stellaceae bacterium]|nr:NUDIX domain-containing protein [Stellaceae bacterium]